MKIFVSGHNGMVGSAIIRVLEEQKKKGAKITILTKNRHELDLTDQQAVRQFFNYEMPDMVIISAAKVGGINANNNYPAEFIYENLMIESNLIHESYSIGIQKLLFLGSSCIYPKMASQPMLESSLLTGLLEPTNEPYAIAKIAGIKLCESYNRQYGVDYRSIMPTNLYGPGDNFNLDNSHVVPALIKKFHEAKLNNTKNVKIWGSGLPLREFLHVDDLAEAAIFVLDLKKDAYLKNTHSMSSHINIGSGVETSIKDLAILVKNVVGYKGQIVFDKSMPDGSPRKLMDSSKINSMGWKYSIDLDEGLKSTYSWYLSL